MPKGKFALHLQLFLAETKGEGSVPRMIFGTVEKSLHLD